MIRRRSSRVISIAGFLSAQLDEYFTGRRLGRSAGCQPYRGERISQPTMQRTRLLRLISIADGF